MKPWILVLRLFFILTIMVKRKRYNEADVELVKKYIELNFSDTDIICETGFKPGFVQKTSTQYWKDKMCNKSN